jgi:hypothetical protein
LSVSEEAQAYVPVGIFTASPAGQALIAFWIAVALSVTPSSINPVTICSVVRAGIPPTTPAVDQSAVLFEGTICAFNSREIPAADKTTMKMTTRNFINDLI